MLVIMGSWKQDHIVNDFPLINAHITDLKSILPEISCLLRETGHISYLDKSEEGVYMKINGCK